MDQHIHFVVGIDRTCQGDIGNDFTAQQTESIDTAFVRNNTVLGRETNIRNYDIAQILSSASEIKSEIR